MGFVVAYITFPDMEQANRLSQHLLSKRLIACANCFPIKSSYWWKGKIEQADEVVCLVKTAKDNWERLKSEVKAEHPYETPCIMRIDAQANREYEDWIGAETKG